MLDERFLAAHCILLSENEKDLLKKYNVKTCHCPFSNCGKGVPQTPRLLAAGIPVAFGSDGAGHGGLDLFREMRAFRCIMNVAWGITTGNPEIMPARTLLAMALEGGAQALMNSSLGSVRRGNLADLIAIDLDQPHLTPTGSIVNTLIESASGADVKTFHHQRKTGNERQEAFDHRRRKSGV